MKRAWLALLLICSACGGNPNDPSHFAQIGGNWSGTLISSNWNAVAVFLALNQSTGTITGTWGAGSADWTGTITGTVSESNFSGTFTLSAPNALGVGPRCTGTAAVSGPASTSKNTVTWTSPGFTGSCTGEPINLTWTLQR